MLIFTLKLHLGYFKLQDRVSSVVFRVDRYFDFIIINVEKAISNRYVLRKGRSMVRIIPEIDGKSSNPKLTDI